MWFIQHDILKYCPYLKQHVNTPWCHVPSMVITCLSGKTDCTPPWRREPWQLHQGAGWAPHMGPQVVEQPTNGCTGKASSYTKHSMVLVYLLGGYPGTVSPVTISSAIRTSELTSSTTAFLSRFFIRVMMVIPVDHVLLLTVNYHHGLIMAYWV